MCVFSPFINATMKSRKKKGRAPSGLIYTVHVCNVFAMSFCVLGLKALNLSSFYFFSCNTFSWYSSFLYIYLSRQRWWRSDSLTPSCGPVGNATLCSAEFFYLDDTLEHTRKGFNSGHIGTLYPGVKSIYLGDLLFRIAFAVETYIANGCERLDPTRKRWYPFFQNLKRKEIDGCWTGSTNKIRRKYTNDQEMYPWHCSRNW